MIYANLLSQVQKIKNTEKTKQRTRDAYRNDLSQQNKNSKNGNGNKSYKVREQNDNNGSNDSNERNGTNGNKHETY